MLLAVRVGIQTWVLSTFGMPAQIREHRVMGITVAMQLRRYKMHISMKAVRSQLMAVCKGGWHPPQVSMMAAGIVQALMAISTLLRGRQMHSPM